MLNLQKGRECFHKIKYFQYHPGCNEQASLCENKCQPLHSSNSPVYSIPITSVLDKHLKIKGKLVATLKGYTDRFKKRYEQIIQGFHKRSADILRNMEKELLVELMKCINASKEVLEKIENERMEKLKCSEIYTFYSDEEYEEKLKDIQLSHIYDKHYNQFLQTYKSFNWEGSPENQTPNKTGHQVNSIEGLQKNGNQREANIIDQLQAELLKIRQKNISLESQLKELIQKSQQKQNRLMRKSWTIASVRLKRRIKRQSKESPNKISPSPQGQSIPDRINESARPNQSDKMDIEDSQDIFQFQARQKK